MLWWRTQTPVHHFSGSIHHTSSHRHHQMSARSVGSVCSYGTDSWHTIPHTSKLTSESISYRNKCLCLLQAGRSHVVTCSDLWKEVWMSDISSESPRTHRCKFNCFWSSINIQCSNFDTIYHKFKLVSKSYSINQKAAQLISQIVDSNPSTFMPNPINMFHIFVHSASRQAPWIFSNHKHVIPFLESAQQPNTTVCLPASSLEANVNIWKVSAKILPIWNNNLMQMHCSLKSVTFWSNKTALDTTHGQTSQQRMPQLWNQQQMTTQLLLHCHKYDEFCTNFSSCGGAGYDRWQPNTSMEGPQCWPTWEPTYGRTEVPIRTNTMRHIPSHWNFCVL